MKFVEFFRTIWLLLFATILARFTELLVMPFPGLPFPLLYTASMFKADALDV